MYNRIKEIEQVLYKRDYRLKYHPSPESNEDNGKSMNSEVRQKSSVFAGMSKEPEPSR